MRLLAISEHYFPRVGGTVNYVHETLSALSRKGIAVEVWVPGPAPAGWLPDELAPPPYKVVWIDAGYPTQGEPDRQTRYRFCHMVNEMAFARARGTNAPDLLHVVFGLFVMEMLDTDQLRHAGLRSVATVHNVPPHECRMVAPNASFMLRFKEEARLQLVKHKNHARLRRHHYDALVVPSGQVRGLLAALVPKQTIDVIGHGPTYDLITRMSPPVCRRPEQGAPVRLLTVGGYAPHKRQHLIPQVATRLRATRINFEWNVVGPSGRIQGYFDGVARAVQEARLEDRVRIRSALSVKELAVLYNSANLYIQPSAEEGFCITALDAAAAGLPVIASPAGALAEIVRVSGGVLVESAPEPISQAIMGFVQGDRWGDAQALGRDVGAQFSWDAAAVALCARYKTLIQNVASDYA